MSPAPAGQECDVLLFEVAGQSFAADPLDVRRVGRPNAELPVLEIRPPVRYERVLVIEGVGGVVQVPVDRILGLRRIKVASLRVVSPLLNAMLESTGTRLVGALMSDEESGPSPAQARPGASPPPADERPPVRTDGGEAAPTLVLDLHAMTATLKHAEEGRNGKDEHG